MELFGAIFRRMLIGVIALSMVSFYFSPGVLYGDTMSPKISGDKIIFEVVEPMKRYRLIKA